MDEEYSDDAAHIQASLSQCCRADWQLPPVNDPAPSDPFNVYDPSLIDWTEFVQFKLRFSHQTKQASTGVRTATQRTSEGSTNLSERQRVLQRFSAILKQQEEKGVGTGLERAARWTRANMTTTSEVGSLSNGNSGNATAVAKAVATKVRELLQL